MVPSAQRLLAQNTQLWSFFPQWDSHVYCLGAVPLGGYGANGAAAPNSWHAAMCRCT